MVSEKVEIDTLSYQEGAEAVKWRCTGGTEYELEASDRSERGTTVTLFLDEEGKEFLNEYKLREVIEKHCSFLPVEIYLENEKEEKKENRKPLNDTHPLWIKNPKDCTEDEYKEFYRKVFKDFKEPLFWIHLNVDYPFNLKGILYFPKLKHELEASEGKIKLYNNQVFVADNIKEIIPEFLLLLKGVIDCADLPLNVSRSFLQKDANVIKISKHITKKVADKLTELFKKERDKYNSFWDDINLFIKYGCMRDESFYDKVKDILIYKTTNGEYVTLQQYLENNKEKHEKKVFYVSDETQQAQYIKLFKENDLEAIILNSAIDSHFINFLEMKESGVQFNRIDSDLSDVLKDKEAAVDENKTKEIENMFKANLGKDKLVIKVESLKAARIPAIMLLSEHSRRMQEMSAMFGGMDVKNMFPNEETLVINKNSELINSLLEMNKDENKKEDVKLICEHIYDLALIGNKQLGAEEMAKFIERSNKILEKLV